MNKVRILRLGISFHSGVYHHVNLKIRKSSLCDMSDNKISCFKFYIRNFQDNISEPRAHIVVPRISFYKRMALKKRKDNIQIHCVHTTISSLHLIQNLFHKCSLYQYTLVHKVHKMNEYRKMPNIPVI